ncbi:twin-arginine translocation pathway signal [Mycobacterium parmense]|uniref:Uncharacterized protein n=1 Tax=Mycobacterium parmense TaxID=185642 RepID=A0A7I7Z3L0_9MYCO|nr:twin-arginine translocation pathway signal [Mycobacterium parmense]MCV7352464.1 twin-arginine translocation pathway signal [Mycobacterium parmense]ORW55795.1 twin-arginine translocation pathway signal [Mycobacterium parmense]BBZ47814.1 hypothetical protein MPRM_50950 [Mycobacterium parmense]
MTADETPVDKAAQTEQKAEADDAAKVEETADRDSPKDIDGRGGAGRPTSPATRTKGRTSARIVAAVLAVLVVSSLALLGALYYFSYLPGRETDVAAAKTAVAAASEGTVAILSYSPDSLDRDFSTAKSHLTGDFLSYYDQFTQQIVAPAAKQKEVKTTAVVLRAAVSDLRPDSAEILLFVNQSTQTKDRPEPTFTNSSVSVKLAKANGKWLISSFSPV